jgi:hypothetical protein
MALLNWPPSKGPLPPHLKVVRSDAVLGIKRRDFAFKQPPQARAERRDLLEAAMEHHGDPKIEEKVGMEFTGKREKTDTEFLLDHPVVTVAQLTFWEADLLIHGVGANTGALTRRIPSRIYEIPLTYPLTLGAEIQLAPLEITLTLGNGKKEVLESQSIGYVLWVVAQEYKRIYADWRLYKPWGHGIEDLAFKAMMIHRGNPHWIELGFDS